MYVFLVLPCDHFPFIQKKKKKNNNNKKSSKIGNETISRQCKTVKGQSAMDT